MDPTRPSLLPQSLHGVAPQIFDAPVVPPGSLLLHACSFCKQRKLKCDMCSPCTNCSKRSLQCFYVERLPGKKRGPKPKNSVDIGVVARIIPREEPGEGLTYLAHEVAKLKAEVHSLRTEQVAQPLSNFSLETQVFLREMPACQMILQEFVTTVMPVLSWYNAPDFQQLQFSWNSMLRDSASNVSETLKRDYEPETVSRNFDSAAIFSLTCGLMRRQELAEHFEDLCQTFLQTIFFKREAKLSAPCLRRVGSALMLLMFRYMTDSKPVATRYIGSFLLEVASQLDSQGAPGDAELLYAISTRVASQCLHSQTTSQWARRINNQLSGRSLLSVIELSFFEIFNHFISSAGNSPDMISGLLAQIDSTSKLIEDNLTRMDGKHVADEALRYYSLWFMMLRAEAQLRLGRQDLVQDVLKPAHWIIRNLPRGLAVALIGLTKFAASGLNGPGLLIAPLLAAKLESLVQEATPHIDHHLQEIQDVPRVEAAADDPVSQSSTSSSPYMSPDNNSMYIYAETMISDDTPTSPESLSSTFDDLFAGF